ncbi:hypothetical protein T265_14677, partial [Opisthorchis viverrini]
MFIRQKWVHSKYEHAFQASFFIDTRWLKWLECEFTGRKIRGSNPTSASPLDLTRFEQRVNISALVFPSGGMAVRHRKGARWPKWLEREFNDRKVCGSNPTSATRLPLSRLGQPGSIPALVLPSGGMAARHRKGATAERSSLSLTPVSMANFIDAKTSTENSVDVNEGSSRSSANVSITIFFNRECHVFVSAVIPFRCLTAIPPEGNTRAEILTRCSNLVRVSREAEVGFEPRIFRPCLVSKRKDTEKGTQQLYSEQASEGESKSYNDPTLLKRDFLTLIHGFLIG